MNKFLKILPYFLLLILFIILFFNLRKSFYAVQFGDEEDNFLIGKWLLEGKILYKDIFYNHQPLPIWLSALIQKILQPNSFFSLIKIHRMAIFLYSLSWYGLFVVSFGWQAFLLALFLEPSKSFLLGNLFLAETISISPVIFIIGIIFKLFSNKKLKSWEIIFFTLSLMIIQITLLPLIPLAIGGGLLFFIKTQKKQKLTFLKGISTGFILIGLISVFFISIRGYFNDTYLTNLIYIIPYEIKINWLQVIIRIFFRPIMVLTLPHEQFYFILKIASLWYLISLILLLIKKHFKIAILGFLLLASTNLRPVDFGIFKNGFHLLPFYASFIWITLCQSKFLWQKIQARIFIVAIGFILGLNSIFLIYKELVKPDLSSIYWQINYSDFLVSAEILKTISNKGDTLFAAPTAPLIYWQSNLSANSPYFFYLGFMKNSQFLTEKIRTKQFQNPPTFIYREEGQNLTGIFPNFYENYQPLFKENKPSFLFIKKNKISGIKRELF